MSTPRLMSGRDYLETPIPPLRSVGDLMRDARTRLDSMSDWRADLAEIERLDRENRELLNQLASVSEAADYLALVKEKHAYLLKAVDEEA